jgi:hypothetical protein
MEDLHKALGDIRSIRRQMARSTEFRGYGPATLAGTAALAFVAAGAQTELVRDPANHITRYLIIWISTAFVSAALAGAQMLTRSRRMHSGMSDEMIAMAVEQFLPSVVASLLVTIVLFRSVTSALCFPVSGKSFSAWGYFRRAVFCPDRFSPQAPGIC